MKIIIVNTYRHWGGDEKWAINLGKGLKARGHEVVIASRAGHETEQRALENGLDIFSLEIDVDIAFWKIPGLVRYIKKMAFDVTICIQNKDVKIFGLAAKISGVKVVLARQALDEIKPRLYHKLAFTRFVNGIITNTNALKKLYLSYGWFPDDFIHTVYDGMEIQANVKDIDLKKMFDFPTDSRVFVGAGRLVYQKGFDLLIKVAKMAKDQNLNWRFIILGKGQLEEDLKRLTKELNVEEHIKFVGFQKDILPLMKAADLFVLSSRSESMTNVLREAMSVKTACVATDVYGISELIEHKISGYIVPPEDPIAIFHGIRTVLESEDLKQTIEENALERIKSKFTIEHMIENTEELLLRLLNKV